MRVGNVLAVAMVVAAVNSVCPFALNAQAPQPAASAAALPDIVGFRPGMPLPEAYKLLKAYKPKLQVQVGEAFVPEISDKKLPHALQVSEGTFEAVRLDVTLPPNQQVVWKVSREMIFAGDQELARSTLIASLREKYGDAYPPDTALQGNATLSWFFDERGQRVTKTNGLMYNNCFLAAGSAAGPTGASLDAAATPLLPPYFRLTGPFDLPIERTMPAFRPCRSLIVISAFLGAGADQNLIRHMSIAMADLGLRVRAYLATYDSVTSAQDGQRKQELDKVQQRPVPKL